MKPNSNSCSCNSDPCSCRNSDVKSASVSSDLSNCSKGSLHKILHPAKCPKKIGPSKFERLDASTQQSWNRKFASLEYKCGMPFYKRKTRLEECFSKNKMDKLMNSGVEINPDWGEDLQYDESLKPQKVIGPPSLCKIASKTSFEKVPKVDKDSTEYTNPYLNFFRKSPKRAQIWRPRPKPTIEDVPLIMKAKLLEEKLATEFDEWFRNVGSKSKSEIDKNVILSIFEIMMSYPVATSMNCEVFEIGSVPEQTAKFLGFPERSESASVQREIKRDIGAGLLKPRLVAFNQTLPIDLRRKPFMENLKEKWFEYMIRHQDLESMAAVWRGITDLHTTKVFINHLLDQDVEIIPPPYLKNEGFYHKQAISNILDINYDYDEVNEEEISSKNPMASIDTGNG